MNGNHKKRTLEASEDFIPSKTWQGSKPGYYFGTAKRGTGYYWDPQQQKDTKPSPPKQKKRAKVMFNEDKNEVFDILAEAEEQAASTKIVGLSKSGVLTATKNLQRAISENAVARAKSNLPESYMDSEINLYEHIVVLKGFAANTSLYDHILESELLSELIQVLVHENVDVVNSVVTVLLEWMDPDLDNIKVLCKTVLRDASELLVENLARMNSTLEDDDEVGHGAEDILNIFVNLLELDLVDALDENQSVAGTICKTTKLLSWLIQNIDNESYHAKALEVLSYLAPQADVYEYVPNWGQIVPYTSSFLEGKAGDEAIDGIEMLLQTLAKFRKKQPSNETDVEILENTCLILTSVLTYSSESAQVFLEAQGIELVIRCLKEKVYAGAVALPWLEFAGSDPVYRKASQNLIKAGALKYVFPLFLGRNLPKHHQSTVSKKAKKDYHHKIERTTIRILYGLVRHLDESSPDDAQERLLAKFTGSDKIKRLVDLISLYDQRVRLAEFNFYKSDFEDTLEDTDDKPTLVQLALLDAKLAAGGDILHRLAAIAGFCCVGSKVCHEQILKQLQAQELGISTVREALEEFISVLGEPRQQKLLQSFLDNI